MYAKILTNIPTLGDTPEIHFGDHFQYSLWIEFMDHNNEKWYGCFSSFYPTDNLQSFNKVLVDQDNNSAFVIVDGIGYIVDIKNRQIKFQPEEHPLIESIIQTQNPNYFITGNSMCINVYDSEKWIKRIFPKELTHNILFTNQISKKVLGNLTTPEIYHNNPINFELDLITFEIITFTP